MEPTSDSGSMRMGAWCGGFIAGVGAQILFLRLINNLVGPVSTLWSGETLLLIIILLAPPVLSRLYLTVEIGSPKESFFKGFQIGAIAWFFKVLFGLLW
jgi:hypothetical protein